MKKTILDCLSLGVLSTSIIAGQALAENSQQIALLFNTVSNVAQQREAKNQSDVNSMVGWLPGLFACFNRLNTSAYLQGQRQLASSYLVGLSLETSMYQSWLSWMGQSGQLESNLEGKFNLSGPAQGRESISLTPRLNKAFTEYQYE